MESGTNLRLIEEMLYTAKKEVKDNGAFFLLWGWLVFIAATTEFALHWFSPDLKALHIGSSVSIDMQGICWLILMPLGGIASIFLSRKQSREEKVKTWFDDVMKYLWIAFGVVLFIVLFTMGYDHVNLFPIVIALYGLGLFITGGVLKFNPLIIGGIFSWVLAFASLFVADEYTNLCLASSVLIGYIIPGYMLKKQSKNLNSHVQTA